MSGTTHPLPILRGERGERERAEIEEETECLNRVFSKRSEVKGEGRRKGLRVGRSEREKGEGEGGGMGGKVFKSRILERFQVRGEGGRGDKIAWGKNLHGGRTAGVKRGEREGGEGRGKRKERQSV